MLALLLKGGETLSVLCIERHYVYCMGENHEKGESVHSRGEFADIVYYIYLQRQILKNLKNNIPY